MLANPTLTLTLLELLLVFALSAGVGLLFHRLRMPPVVGYLAAGALVGPNAAGLVYERALVEELAEVGVVVLLFTVGMELSLAELRRMRRAVLAVGGVQIAGTVALGAATAAAFGCAPGPAIFVGYLLSLSSTAAITRLLADRGQLGTPPGRTALSACIAQDLAVVPMVLSLPLLAAGTNAGPAAALRELAISLAGFAAIAAAAWFLVPRLLDVFARSRSRELYVLGVIVSCLCAAVFTALLGMSLALGAFVAGVVIGSSNHHHQAVAEIEPFRDALSSLFFFSIGMLFDARVVVATPLPVLAGLVAVVAGKALVAGLAVRAGGLPAWLAWRAGPMLAQVGEFSFVLVGIAAAHRLLDPALERAFLFVAVATIALTPALFAIGERLGRVAGRPSRPPGDLDEHVVIVGFGPAGQGLARSLGELGIPYRVVELNADTVRAARARGVPIEQGDASRAPLLRAVRIARARLLVIATNDPESARRIVFAARQQRPGLRVLVRANYLADVPRLAALGVDEIVPQELETSVEITARVLRHYLVPEDEVERRVAAIRDEASGLARATPARAVRGVPLDVPVEGLRVAAFRVELGARLAGRTLGDSHLRHTTGLSVVAVQRGGRTLLGVGPETLLEVGDVAVGIGPSDALERAALLFRGPDPLGALHGATEAVPDQASDATPGS
ncbi:MAG: cation:proton antiporter [Planctomycetes bacterium]|nr:cation:proton antiporter [Planctomycetota bacterium]